MLKRNDAPINATSAERDFHRLALSRDTRKFIYVCFSLFSNCFFLNFQLMITPTRINSVVKYAERHSRKKEHFRITVKPTWVCGDFLMNPTSWKFVEKEKRSLPHQCPQCDMKFAQACALKAHMIVHLGQFRLKPIQFIIHFQLLTILKGTKLNVKYAEN